MKRSAGLLLYKKHHTDWLFLLAHPGGPFWKNKDLGSWSVPKGEFTAEEAPLAAAIREFHEETGIMPEGDFIKLSPVQLKSGKIIEAWALESDLDVNAIKSNTFEIEWPPKSKQLQKFPEIDRCGWFTAREALQKINAAQAGFIHEIIKKMTSE